MVDTTIVHIPLLWAFDVKKKDCRKKKYSNYLEHFFDY